MRILSIDFYIPYLLKDENYPIGGWAIELTTWLRALDNAGHEAAVLTWKGALTHVGSNPPITLIETYDPKRGVRIARWFYSFIPKLLAAARAYRPDIIIQGARGLGTAVMAFIADQLGVPFVYRVVSDADVDERYKIGLRQYEQLSYSWARHRAAGFLCQNQYQRDQLAALFPGKPIHVLHNPIAISENATAPLPRAERRYVAWLGVFRYPKNLPLLFRIAQELPDVEFRVAGMLAEAADQPTIDAVNGLSRLQNVKMVGYVRRVDIQSFLSEATMLLCTSRYEGFSNAFLEALAVGTPVVTSRPVDPDLIVLRHALGASAADELALCRSVRAIWDTDANDYNALAQRCQTYVKANHSPTVKASELIVALTPLVAKSNAARLRDHDLPPA
ncbi:MULTISPECIES: glycosyltransferase family 4 protein [Bradyrhizobium]|uniref:Glycosyltransferase n=1 Tax=Bradyrhizobium arachidis TaxID=858423 RepID=A0AAE7TGE7_9BRAD|nr:MULTISPECIES: glycosyltransferase family 4 protein [Bradyrhizobium]QOG22565.1 glycosyltransferase [Bradyrhizobium sp. SEMIA]QOZ68152.1 glycosyltransferase [Bradyrhizobium arachidis]UFW52827.1 glycosyltransferase family 4 protein [Bradyrhizobium arachidis]SFU86996.1 Glycosyltransferase involved in cell wall bisynthesis [Bradyrhizobium arachidis]